MQELSPIGEIGYLHLDVTEEDQWKDVYSKILMQSGKWM